MILPSIHAMLEHTQDTVEWQKRHLKVAIQRGVFTKIQNVWPNGVQYKRLFAEAGKSIPIHALGCNGKNVPYHPDWIYESPKPAMYFLKCERLVGPASFGFPRTANGDKKVFGWRKMSFITKLPKKDPIIEYVTATCYAGIRNVNSGRSNFKVFRMHAVMLLENSHKPPLVLVHIKSGGCKNN